MMKGVLFHLLLLFVQIYLASKLASSTSSIGKNAGLLIKTKSGKYFLQLSSKKKETTESGNDYSNDGNANGKVTGTGKQGTKVKPAGKKDAEVKLTGEKGTNVRVTEKKDAKVKETGGKGGQEKATGKRGVNKQLPNYGK